VTPFEKLLAIASGEGEVLELARDMIGKKELALLLAKAALSNTTEDISPTVAAKVLGITRDGARKKIDNAAVRSGELNAQNNNALVSQKKFGFFRKEYSTRKT
jgi:hypothetical protein